MKQIALFLACLVSALSVMAANFTGTVIDENNQPLPYANVVLLTITDSTYIAGDITDGNGSFAVNCKCRQAVVKISYIGYETKYILASSQEVGTVQLMPEATMLGEVVVKATRPVFKLTTEGIKTDVGGTLLSRVGTANDVLQNLPGATSMVEKCATRVTSTSSRAMTSRAWSSSPTQAQSTRPMWRA